MLLYTFLGIAHFPNSTQDLILSTSYPTKDLTNPVATLEEEALHPQALLHVRLNTDVYPCFNLER
jgi:hypothetical protein